jgi:hypothetical protein
VFVELIIHARIEHQIIVEPLVSVGDRVAVVDGGIDAAAIPRREREGPPIVRAIGRDRRVSPSGNLRNPLADGREEYGVRNDAGIDIGDAALQAQAFCCATISAPSERTRSMFWT